ncbi:hypothetical protein GOP47_0026701 [Adiantum capillus-veneris]|nr:hypothetical protein GOP47_0026701 [Adiantum capillus-veneris]
MRRAASKLLHPHGSDFTLKKVPPVASLQGFSSVFLKKSFARGFPDTSNSDESDGDEKEKIHKGCGNGKKKPSKGQVAESDEDDEKVGRWNSQLAWLNNILESALSLYKRALPPGESEKTAKPAMTRSLVDIALNLHKSTMTGMQQWSLGDLTFGLYLLSLRHASEMDTDTISGEQISSPSVVADLIYHAELAKGAYMKSAATLARVSMLRESNVIKFIDNSSVMRPAYYIAVDPHEKLVVLGIRGTSSVHDLITDLVSHSDEEIKFDGGSVHYGTAKAAEWFIVHELPTLREHIDKYSGFRLRIVGHSLGGATAALLAMMLRRKSKEELGFSPGIVTAIGFASPPCVSGSLAIKSASFVRTVILQDDVIPRVSAATLLRLRNEILELDWASFRKEAEERKGVLDLVASTVQALSSVQEVARRYTAYAGRFGPAVQKECKDTQKQVTEKSALIAESTQLLHPVEELFAPGSLYHIRGNPIFLDKLQKLTENREGCTLWKVHSNEFLRRIVLSGSFFKDHKCDCYYQGLRDTLKGL